ncbi:MAG: rRNA pseudouridine synthase [Ignavibacteriales bacterium]|nr:rRNA pseudouridine synthase [Ignavibacteriales bacterium]
MERKDSILHQETVRLNRYLALAGVGSRRKNDELILSGAVKINGRVVKELGTRVHPARDRVMVQGKTVELAQKYVYILFNKPKDCITTVSDERGRTTVMHYVRVRQRVYPIGRLDRDTTGILLLTNDGALAHQLTHPSFEVEKVYRARLDRGIVDADVRSLMKGIRLREGAIKVRQAAVLPATRKTEVLITVHEGRNHLVKRIFEKIGYDVKRLDRVAFAGLTTTGVARGKWRFLNWTEVQHLKSGSAIKQARQLDV